MNSFLENRPVAARKDGTVPPSKPAPGFHTLIPQESPPKPKADPAPASAAETDALPQIELVQNGGKIERIIVTCTCCKRIEMQCQY
jgi:hypothetical protein